MSVGYVYVLSNESMPGIVKIGRSKRSGSNRATELYKNNTGVATPFKLEFELLCEDMNEAEAIMHERLQNHRVNGNREFFRIELHEAVFALIEETVCASFDFFVVTEWDYADSADIQFLSNRANVVGPEFGSIIAEMTPEEYGNIYARVIAKRAIRNVQKQQNGAS